MGDDLFSAAIEYVLENEGGLAENPVRDGTTNYGLSSKDYPDLDIKNLTREEAEEIYRHDWWGKYGYDRIRPPEVAVKVFDMAVNMGPGTAIRLLQKALVAAFEPVKVDGVLGPETLGAIERVDPDELIGVLIVESKEHYLSLIDKNPDLERFKKGWFNRARRVPNVENDREEEKAMLGKLSSAGSWIGRVGNILSFVLPFIRFLWSLVIMVEEREEEEDRGSEDEKKFVLSVLEEIYKLADDVTEDDLPVPWESFENRLTKIYEGAVGLLEKINFFRDGGEGAEES